MLSFFIPVKKFIKHDQVSTDNFVFKLHYRATVILLITASLLVTSKQFFGEPISCLVNGIPQNFMDTYCWIQTTFTIPTLSGPHPGVAPLDKDHDPKHHKYYQWVCFVLCIQAACFYLPRYLWKNMEDDKIEILIQNLQNPLDSCQCKENEAKNSSVSNYGSESQNEYENLPPPDVIHCGDCRELQISNFVRYWQLYSGTHSSYALKFFFCEILTLCNVIIQIFFTDLFLDHEFKDYGLEVLRFPWKDQYDRVDPMSRIFPKLTKCTFYKYGSSGTIEHIDGLCVLPLNVINEKIYIFLWFWFVGLAFVTAISLIYKLAIISSSPIQVYLIKANAGRSVKSSHIKGILGNGLTHMQKFGDWFVLHLVTSNLDCVTVNKIIEELHDEIEAPILKFIRT